MNKNIELNESASSRRRLAIAWADVSWEVQVRNRQSGGCRLDREILRLVRSRFEPFAVPGDVYQQISLRRWRSRSAGFTLVELLVVIAIIAILAGILLPTLGAVKTRAKVANARTEMQGLAASIKSYEGDYNRYPASPAAEQAASAATPPSDFTFANAGTTAPIGAPTLTPFPIPSGTKYDANNSEVVLLLLDIDQGINANHVRNPRKQKYWNPKMVSTDAGGVSTADYVTRDPWGSPYVITVDMNDDNKCVDSIYGQANVSRRPAGGNVGFHGLSRPNDTAPFELNGPVMIWSPGPDKGYDANSRANAGLNKDNVLSWSN